MQTVIIYIISSFKERFLGNVQWMIMSIIHCEIFQFQRKNQEKYNSKSQLLDSIEIAKQLLDVLDEETISKKLGLDLEIIKSLKKQRIMKIQN